MRLFIPTSFCALLFSAGACGDEHSHNHTADTMSDTMSDTGILTDAGVDATADDAAVRPDLGGGEGVAPADRATTTTLSDGVTRRTVVDADDTASWVHIDLRTGDGVAPADPATDSEWVLAIQRYKVRANGGTSGPLGVTVTHAGGDFDAIDQAASEGWRDDDDTKTTEDGEIALAFAEGGGWYDYDGANHVLTPKEDRVYFVRVPASPAERFFKLRFRDYYDASGNAGVVTFDWAPVSAPADPLPAGAFRVPNGKVDLATESAVTDGETWDLELGVGGTVAIGSAQGVLLATDAWDDLNTTDTVGFINDAPTPAPGPPGSPMIDANAVISDWYDYNPSTHAVTPKDAAWIVRRADGTYRAVRILGYDDAGWILETKDVTRAPAVHSMTVEAPSAAAMWAHIDLAAGVEVDLTEAPEAAWDLALLGVNAQTNSGTSGGGKGGAATTTATALAELTEAPEDGWVDDAMAPIPGPPGSGEVSGNAVLAGWYNYDMTTHAITPKAAVFAVRLSDGTVAKVQVDAYASGTWTLSWVYAGPGATTF